MRRLLLSILLLAATLAHAADYAREKKWADEITPGIVTGDPVYLEAGSEHKFLTLFTAVPNAKGAVVVVHGMGVHPDWNLIGVLRNGLSDAGYTTLSVQMPVLANNAKPEDYSPTFPEASKRLEAAVAFLQAKGYKGIAIVSHSMGSRMADYYLSKHPGAPIHAWVAIGLSGNYAGLKGTRFPVLDLYGENDLPPVLKSAKTRAAAIQGLPGSEQIKAPKADHFFNNRDTELVDYVKGFLDKSLVGKN